MGIKKAEVSKRHYSVKAVGSNVRGVSTFFDTCLKLGHIFQYNFKTLYGNFPENSIKQLIPLCYCMERFEIDFAICVKFCPTGIAKIYK